MTGKTCTACNSSTTNLGNPSSSPARRFDIVGRNGDADRSLADTVRAAYILREGTSVADRRHVLLDAGRQQPVGR